MGDGVNVSMDNIYNELRKNSEALILLTEQVRQLSEEVKAFRSDHESRLRALEFKLWYFSGIAVVLGAVGGILFPLIAK